MSDIVNDINAKDSNGNTDNTPNSTGLQLEQLANKNQLTIRLKWSSIVSKDESEKDDIINELSNCILYQKGNIINPLKIENYEYLSDIKRLEVIRENHYEFEHGSKEFAKSYDDDSTNWMFDIVQQAHFKKDYYLENCATNITTVLKEVSEKVDRWSLTINHHSLTHPGNLFIGGISRNITITRVMDLCKQYGPIESIKLIHDKVKGNDIGYGFVSYQMGSHASRCIQMLNGKEVEGSTLFINYHVDRKERENLHWSQVKENTEEKNFKCLFIGNIPKRTDTDVIITPNMIIDLITESMSKKFQNFLIVSYYFPRDSNGNQNKISGKEIPLKGYGFVKLERAVEILGVIDQFNGFNWFGNELIVNKAVQNRIQNSSQRNIINSGINISNNSINHFNRNKHQEKSIITSKGNSIVEPQIPQYVETSHANYHNVGGPDSNIEINDLSRSRANSNLSGSGHSLNGTSTPLLTPMIPPMGINNEYTYKSPAGFIANPYVNGLPIPLNSQQESNLYVKHIPLDWDDNTLHDFYECFGRIISSKVITIGGSINHGAGDDGKTAEENSDKVGIDEAVGLSKGYGFVCFENPIDASRAILATNRCQLNSGSTLSVSFANKKSNNGNINSNSSRTSIISRGTNGENNQDEHGLQAHFKNLNLKQENNSRDTFTHRHRNLGINNGINRQLPYNKKFMSALMQQQNQLLMNPPLNIPPTPTQNFPLYMNTAAVNNVQFFHVPAYNPMSFQYPGQS
ncbi:hypothetical protein C6P45_004432 [Maudiozyma exigua]|uniref:RRM domain-containing protein n=1 Tax=Maudiozyma exigua TaxID=34358 RepID=A0A9P7BCA0_MAUEX|nr:hypothetical protein C6P45_004432 [Kazachstania exigua]